jgi:hypothetical protein
MFGDLSGYRTYLIAFFMALFGVLEATDWTTFMQDPKAGFAVVISAVLMALMRSITTGPPGTVL